MRKTYAAVNGVKQDYKGGSLEVCLPRHCALCSLGLVMTGVLDLFEGGDHAHGPKSGLETIHPMGHEGLAEWCVYRVPQRLHYECSIN